jgi:DNA-binding NarL/FixJ family response regulator
VVLHPTQSLTPVNTHGFPRSPARSQGLEELAEALTPREGEVLQMLASGLGNKEIAAKLAISEHTVKFHVASILGKLGATSRTEAVSLGIRRGLIML